MQDDELQSPRSRIALITATRNAEETVLECVNSVYMQTLQPDEHLIIDGCSSDRTIEIIKCNAAPYVKVLSSHDSGVYEALNKGIVNSSSEIVGFIHSDDWFASKAVLADVVNLFRNPLIDVVYSDLCVVKSYHDRNIIRYWRAGSFYPVSLSLGWMPPHPTIFARRSVYKKIGLFDTSFKISGDYDFILRLLSDTSLGIKYLPKISYVMRAGGTSNGSVRKEMHKLTEDWKALSNNNFFPLPAIIGKKFLKIPQFFGNKQCLLECSKDQLS